MDWGIRKKIYNTSKKPKLFFKNKLNKYINNNNDDEDYDFLNNTNDSDYIYTKYNHIYFNNNITKDTAFELTKVLRNVENLINITSITNKTKKVPIYLHITTDGGLIYSALSIIDCIKLLSVDVYTIVDGFVASAGTLIVLAGKKRFMCENAYMLIHELRGGIWGKMTEIEEEYINLKKIMKHLINIYIENTNLTKSELKEILKKDLIWNINECITNGLIHEQYK
jgi:ATP-dependent protease ClpP protease subunit